MTDPRPWLRRAVRPIRRHPGFSLVVVLTMAFGIGASTAMFSVLNAVLLAPLPQRNAERIVRLYQPNSQSSTTGLSPLEIADYLQQTRSLEEVVEYHSMPFTFVGTGEAQRLQTGVVSANFLDVLGVEPLVGRSFRAGEDQEGADPVLMLSYEYWQREHGGNPDVVGTTLRMNDRSHTVVGVLPQLPQYPGANDVYMPISSCPFRSDPGWAENRQARGTVALALVREGVTDEALASDLELVANRLHAAYPEAYPADRAFGIEAVSLTELLARPVRPVVFLLLAATVLLLLIVCSNVGNLMIVRFLRRESELAVRAAFGATRGRIARQLAAESIILALAGGALGVLLAYASTGSLASFAGRLTPRAAEIGMSEFVLLFALAATAFTAVVSGLLPITALRLDTTVLLSGASGRTSARGAHTRIRDALIVLQVAVSLVLLTGSGLLLRTVVHLQGVETGVDTNGVMTARLDLNWSTYEGAEARSQFFDELEHELLARPGVRAMGVGSTFPLNGEPASGITVITERQLLAGLEGVNAAVTTASPGYFAALGVPLLRGRVFGREDEAAEGEIAAVVTRSFAARHWPDTEAVGERVSFDGGQSWGRVVGVVGDVRLGLDADFEELVFVPHNLFGGIGARLLVRGDLTPASLDNTVRTAAAAVDPLQPVTELSMLEAHRAERLAPYRLTALLMTLFALVALALTTAGLGGVVAYSVAQRTQEIGIRVAIGARPTAVLRVVLGRTLVLVAVGVVLGAFAARLLAGSLQGVLAGTSATDPLSFALAVVSLAGVSVIAAMVPARHAVRIDPLEAIRSR